MFIFLGKSEKLTELVNFLSKNPLLRVGDFFIRDGPIFEFLDTDNHKKMYSVAPEVSFTANSDQNNCIGACASELWGYRYRRLLPMSM